MLTLAVDWKEADQVPKVSWMKIPKPDFDFLSFEEADRLVSTAEPEWKTMVLVALHTGLRLGELTALQWDCVDLIAGRVIVKRNLYRGRLGSPKNGRSREIPLSNTALRALKTHRHLRGPWVFCTANGQLLNAYNRCENAIARQCRRAGLRPVGWHTLRHSFASHLVMKGAPLKVVQELMGHATIEMTMRYSL
jgi:integrase